MTDDAQDDVSDEIQGIMIETAAKLEAAGLDPLFAAHHQIASALVSIEMMVCRDHLGDELRFVEDAVAAVRARVLGPHH